MLLHSMQDEGMKQFESYFDFKGSGVELSSKSKM